MAECIFCKIAKGEIPSVKIWEDGDFLCILDVNPTVEGQALVITKQHYGSHIFDMPKMEYKSFLLSVKKAAKFLERGLRADRILMVAEGLEVDHAHIRLYPYYNKLGNSLVIKQGNKKTESELQTIANKIMENNK